MAQFQHNGRDVPDQPRAPNIEAVAATGEEPRAQNADPGEPLGPLSEEFARLTSSLLAADNVGAALQQIISAAEGVVHNADLVSLTLRSPDGRFHTPVETNAIATELDQLQYELAEGPCLSAAIETGPAFAASSDLAHDEQWPRFSKEASKRGMVAVCSTALLTAEPAHQGALSIYSRSVNGLTEDDRALALLLATYASFAIAHNAALDMAGFQEIQLQRSIDQRGLIEQAKGILMHRRGMSEGQAFNLLRSASYELNIKLTALAGILADSNNIGLEPRGGQRPGPQREGGTGSEL